MKNQKQKEANEKLETKKQMKNQKQTEANENLETKKADEKLETKSR